MRDEFSKATKENLALRVAHRCSYPNCPAITVGPGHASKDQVIKTGEAAHITAASPGGPRYDPSLSSEERRSFDNGIWMCSYHADLIDKDHENFAAQTLRLWKKQAELRAKRALENTGKSSTTPPNTLIAITNKIIFYGIWKSVSDNVWTFIIGDFIEGDISDLKRFSINQSNVRQTDRFIIVESEGDGREMEKFTWTLSQDNGYEISCTVLPQAQRISPHQVGGDIALGDDFDISFADGDFALVEGLDAALQTLRIVLSTPLGAIYYARESGSHLPYFFQKYRNNIQLLGRLIKLDLSRLLTVKVNDDILDQHSRSPELNFVGRVLNVEVLSLEPHKNQIPLRLTLEWGNGEVWKGDINCAVNPDAKVDDFDL